VALLVASSVPLLVTALVSLAPMAASIILSMTGAASVIRPVINPTVRANQSLSLSNSASVDAGKPAATLASCSS